MAASRKKTKQKSKLKRSLASLVPTTPKGRLLAFAIIIALIGAGYLIYTKAAVRTPLFFIRNTNNAGVADSNFAYGNQGDKPLVCDWDGNGTETIGIYRGNRFFLRDANTTGVANLDFTYGNTGDIPICGDWNGDGRDTIGVYQPNIQTFQLRNSNTSGNGEVSIKYGDPGDIPLACDWNGDGRTDIGVFRPSKNRFYLSYSPLGWTNHEIPYGDPGDVPLCGNWDGLGGAGVGIYRPGNATFYLANTITAPSVTYQFHYGNVGDTPIVGDWDGNKSVTVGITRLGTLPQAPAPSNPANAPGRGGGGSWTGPGGSQPPQAVTNAPAASGGAGLLRLGSNGGEVASLQQRLANRGFWIATTGDYNQATEITVRSFQKVRSISADGIAGPQTFAQLAAAEAEGWRFNPNDPRLSDSAPVVTVIRDTAAQAALPTADQINVYFALLRAAEAAAAQDAIRAAAEAAARNNAIADAAARARAAEELAARVRATQAAQNFAQNFRNGTKCPPAGQGLIACHM